MTLTKCSIPVIQISIITILLSSKSNSNFFKRLKFDALNNFSWLVKENTVDWYMYFNIKELEKST